jgi:hypothetical protein
LPASNQAGSSTPPYSGNIFQIVFSKSTLSGSSVSAAWPSWFSPLPQFQQPTNDANDRQRSGEDDEGKPHKRRELSQADIHGAMEIPAYQTGRTTKRARRSRDKKKGADRDVGQTILNDKISKRQVRERNPY